MHLQCRRSRFDTWVGKIPWRRLSIPGFLGFPGGSDSKNLPAMWETWVRSLGWEDPLEEGMATHSSILAWRIPMDRGAWWATVRGVTKSQTWLNNWARTRAHHNKPPNTQVVLDLNIKISGCFKIHLSQQWYFVTNNYHNSYYSWKQLNVFQVITKHLWTSYEICN